MTGNIRDEVRELVAEIIEVPVEELTLDADFFKDLKVDSLKAIEIVAACEKKYKIVIPEKEIPNMLNLGKVVEYIVNMKKG